MPYRSYKNFDNARLMKNFHSEIFTQSTSLTKDTLNTFQSVCWKVLEKISRKGKNKGYLNKESSEAVLQRCFYKKVFRKLQQIYRRRPMPKCDFNKVSQQLYQNHTSAPVYSCKFAIYFQNTLLNHPNAMAISSIYKHRERFCSVMLQLKKLYQKWISQAVPKHFEEILTKEILNEKLHLLSSVVFEFYEAILNSIHSWCVSFLLVISNKSKTK